MVQVYIPIMELLPVVFGINSTSGTGNNFMRQSRVEFPF